MREALPREVADRLATDEGVARALSVDLQLDLTAAEQEPDGTAEPITRFTIPLFDGQTLGATRRRVDRNFDGSSTWVGRTDDGGGAYMTVIDGETYGLIFTGADMYTLEPDRAGSYVLTLAADVDEGDCGVDDTGLPPDIGYDEELLQGAPPEVDGPSWWEWLMSWFVDEAEASTDWVYGDPTAGPSEWLDLLVVYTSEAKDDKGGRNGMHAFIHNQVQVMNQIWENSGVNDYRVRVVWIDEVLTMGPDPWPDPCGDTDATDTDCNACPPSQTLGAGFYDKRFDQYNCGGGDAPNNGEPGSPMAFNNNRLYDTSLGLTATGAAQPNVAALRDWSGADVTVLLTAQGYGNATGVGSPPDDIAPVTESPPAHDGSYTRATVSSGPGATEDWAFAHEVGHVLGLHHYQDVGFYYRGSKRFAAGVPNDGDPQFRTLMAKNTSGENLPRIWAMSNIHRYWNPDEGLPWGSGPGNRADGDYEGPSKPDEERHDWFRIGNYEETYPTDTAADTDALYIDAVTYLNSTSPTSDIDTADPDATPVEIVMHYRDSVAGIYDVADILTPVPFEDVSGSSVTFSWRVSDYVLVEAEPDTDTDIEVAEEAYWLDLGSTRGASDYLHASIDVDAGDFADTGTFPLFEYPVTATWSGSGPVYARLWTQVFQNTWVYKDFRYNSRDRLLSCEDVGLGEGACVLRDDTESFVYPCVLTGDELDCDFSDAEAYDWGAIDLHADVEPGWDFDYLIRAETNGGALCCVLDDHDTPLDSVILHGSGYADTIDLDLEPVTNNHLGVEVRALGGADLIEGSASDDTGYVELLNGQRGNDTIHGNGGRHDILLGGKESDALTGGAGDDVLIDEEGTADTLDGGSGSDVLCIGDDGDTITASGASTFYQSSTSASTPTTALALPSGSICGSDALTFPSPGWDECDTTTLSTAPAICATFGIED